MEERLGFDVGRLGKAVDLSVPPALALSWKRLDAAAVVGRLGGPSDSVRAVFGRGACSGSSDFLFTPATVLLAATLVPLVVLVCSPARG